METETNKRSKKTKEASSTQVSYLSKPGNPPFSQFILVSVMLAVVVFLAAFLAEGEVPILFIAAVFLLIVIHGYFFYQATRKINNITLSHGKIKEALEEAKKTLEVRVAARTRELKELTERQEEAIQERTRELEKRMKEMEKFYNLAVGRELKMKELKKELKELKEKQAIKKSKN